MQRLLVIWCPGILEPQEHGREARVFGAVVAALESFATRVDPVRPGVCAVPTRGPSRYFGGDGVLARMAAEAAAREMATDPVAGEPAGVGVADGLFAAVLAARAALGGDPVIVPRGRDPLLPGPVAGGHPRPARPRRPARPAGGPHPGRVRGAARPPCPGPVRRGRCPVPAGGPGDRGGAARLPSVLPPRRSRSDLGRNRRGGIGSRGGDTPGGVLGGLGRCGCPGRPGRGRSPGAARARGRGPGPTGQGAGAGGAGPAPPLDRARRGGRRSGEGPRPSWPGQTGPERADLRRAVAGTGPPTCPRRGPQPTAARPAHRRRRHAPWASAATGRPPPSPPACRWREDRGWRSPGGPDPGPPMSGGGRSGGGAAKPACRSSPPTPPTCSRGERGSWWLEATYD